jgi:hypothetical protein
VVDVAGGPAAPRQQGSEEVIAGAAVLGGIDERLQLSMGHAW